LCRTVEKHLLNKDLVGLLIKKHLIPASPEKDVGKDMGCTGGISRKSGHLHLYMHVVMLVALAFLPNPCTLHPLISPHLFNNNIILLVVFIFLFCA